MARTKVPDSDYIIFRTLWSERIISNVVINRLFDAGLWDRRGDCSDRRECKSGDRRKDLK